MLLLPQVEEIALLNTTLIKWDGSRVLYPNYKMNTDMIVNITRSNNKGELFTCLIDIGTPLSVFEEVARLVMLHSEPSPDINAIAVSPGNGGNPLKFTLVVWWEYTFNSKPPSAFPSTPLPPLSRPFTPPSLCHSWHCVRVFLPVFTCSCIEETTLVTTLVVCLGVTHRTATHCWSTTHPMSCQPHAYVKSTPFS